MRSKSDCDTLSQADPQVEGFTIADHRYIVKADGSEVLVHPASDPGEYDNLATQPAHAAALADCRHELLRRLLELERPLARTWPY
jgi:hypothetical protein